MWKGVIVEHDGCVGSGGCDLVAYDKGHFFIIEIKGGRISSSDASKVTKQIDSCEEFYANMIGYKRKHRIFLHCDSRRMRLESYAREKLKEKKIRIHKCQGRVELKDLK